MRLLICIHQDTLERKRRRSLTEQLEKPCSPHLGIPQLSIPCVGSPRQENCPHKWHAQSSTQPATKLYLCLLLLSDSANAFLHLYG